MGCECSPTTRTIDGEFGVSHGEPFSHLFKFNYGQPFNQDSLVLLHVVGFDAIALHSCREPATSEGMDFHRGAKVCTLVDGPSVGVSPVGKS